MSVRRSTRFNIPDSGKHAQDPPKQSDGKRGLRAKVDDLHPEIPVTSRNISAIKPRNMSTRARNLANASPEVMGILQKDRPVHAPPRAPSSVSNASTAFAPRRSTRESKPTLKFQQYKSEQQKTQPPRLTAERLQELSNISQNTVPLDILQLKEVHEFSTASLHFNEQSQMAQTEAYNLLTQAVQRGQEANHQAQIAQSEALDLLNQAVQRGKEAMNLSRQSQEAGERTASKILESVENLQDSSLVSHSSVFLPRSRNSTEMSRDHSFALGFTPVRCPQRNLTPFFDLSKNGGDLGWIVSEEGKNLFSTSKAVDDSTVNSQAVLSINQLMVLPTLDLSEIKASQVLVPSGSYVVSSGDSSDDDESTTNEISDQDLPVNHNRMSFNERDVFPALASHIISAHVAVMPNLDREVEISIYLTEVLQTYYDKHRNYDDLETIETLLENEGSSFIQVMELQKDFPDRYRTLKLTTQNMMTITKAGLLDSLSLEFQSPVKYQTFDSFRPQNIEGLPSPYARPFKAGEPQYYTPRPATTEFAGGKRTSTPAPTKSSSTKSPSQGGKGKGGGDDGNDPDESGNKDSGRDKQGGNGGGGRSGRIVKVVPNPNADVYGTYQTHDGNMVTVYRGEVQMILVHLSGNFANLVSKNFLNVSKFQGALKELHQYLFGKIKTAMGEITASSRDSPRHGLRSFFLVAACFLDITKRDDTKMIVTSPDKHNYDDGISDQDVVTFLHYTACNSEINHGFIVALVLSLKGEDSFGFDKILVELIIEDCRTFFETTCKNPHMIQLMTSFQGVVQKKATKFHANTLEAMIHVLGNNGLKKTYEERKRSESESLKISASAVLIDLATDNTTIVSTPASGGRVKSQATMVSKPLDVRQYGNYQIPSDAVCVYSDRLHVDLDLFELRCETDKNLSKLRCSQGMDHYICNNCALLIETAGPFYQRHLKWKTFPNDHCFPFRKDCMIAGNKKQVYSNVLDRACFGELGTWNGKRGSFQFAVKPEMKTAFKQFFVPTDAKSGSKEGGNVRSSDNGKQQDQESLTSDKKSESTEENTGVSAVVHVSGTKETVIRDGSAEIVITHNPNASNDSGNPLDILSSTAEIQGQIVTANDSVSAETGAGSDEDSLKKVLPPSPKAQPLDQEAQAKLDASANQLTDVLNATAVQSQPQNQPETPPTPPVLHQSVEDSLAAGDDGVPSGGAVTVSQPNISEIVSPEIKPKAQKTDYFQVVKDNLRKENLNPDHTMCIMFGSTQEQSSTVAGDATRLIGNSASFPRFVASFFDAKAETPTALSKSFVSHTTAFVYEMVFQYFNGSFGLTYHQTSGEQKRGQNTKTDPYTPENIKRHLTSLKSGSSKNIYFPAFISNNKSEMVQEAWSKQLYGVAVGKAEHLVHIILALDNYRFPYKVFYDENSISCDLFTASNSTASIEDCHFFELQSNRKTCARVLLAHGIPGQPITSILDKCTGFVNKAIDDMDIKDDSIKTSVRDLFLKKADFMLQDDAVFFSKNLNKIEALSCQSLQEGTVVTIQISLTPKNARPVDSGAAACADEKSTEVSSPPEFASSVLKESGRPVDSGAAARADEKSTEVSSPPEIASSASNERVEHVVLKPLDASKDSNTSKITADKSSAPQPRALEPASSLMEEERQNCLRIIHSRTTVYNLKRFLERSVLYDRYASLHKLRHFCTELNVGIYDCDALYFGTVNLPDNVSKLYQMHRYLRHSASDDRAYIACVMHANKQVGYFEVQFNHKKEITAVHGFRKLHEIPRRNMLFPNIAWKISDPNNILSSSGAVLRPLEV